MGTGVRQLRFPMVLLQSLPTPAVHSLQGPMPSLSPRATLDPNERTLLRTHILGGLLQLLAHPSQWDEESAGPRRYVCLELLTWPGEGTRGAGLEGTCRQCLPARARICDMGCGPAGSFPGPHRSEGCACPDLYLCCFQKLEGLLTFFPLPTFLRHSQSLSLALLFLFFAICMRFLSEVFPAKPPGLWSCSASPDLLVGPRHVPLPVLSAGSSELLWFPCVMPSLPLTGNQLVPLLLCPEAVRYLADDPSQMTLCRPISWFKSLFISPLSLTSGCVKSINFFFFR